MLNRVGHPLQVGRLVEMRYPDQAELGRVGEILEEYAEWGRMVYLVKWPHAEWWHRAGDIRVVNPGEGE